MTYLEVENPVREMSTKRIAEKLYPQIQFVETNFIDDHLASDLECKNLIVGFSDCPVTKSQVEKFKSLGGKHMFAKNLSCEENECVKCFPIGLEDQFRWYNYDKFDLMRQCRENFKGNINDSTIYLNFSVHNNFRKRSECLQMFSENANAVVDQNTFNGSVISHFSMEATRSFYNNVLQNRFTASPDGNGIDCQRTYEILLLGRIPVCVKNTVVTSEFAQKLPILVLDSWDQFNEKSKEFLGSYDETKYDFSVLSEDCWLNHIKQVIG